MDQWPLPVLRTMDEIVLVGTMAVYDTQDEASERIPEQWRAFRLSYPELGNGSALYGASPCTNDRKIHYLTGVAEQAQKQSLRSERLTLEAGEYAFVRVEDRSRLRDTWIWLLRDWLPNSGRQERHAPEFERYSHMSETGQPIGPVELWIPLEPSADR